MTELIVPFRPSNLEVPPEMRNAYVEGDLFNICERVAEVSPHLGIIPLPEARHPWKYAIVEHCRDGVERLVFEVRELDGRVIQELHRIMAKPLSERVKDVEAMEHQWEAEEVERELEDMYERFGRDMWSQLEHDGFVQRGVSYPKAGVATRGRVRR